MRVHCSYRNGCDAAVGFGADLRTIIGVSCLLSLIALLASWRPARRAGRIDPVIALREA